MTAELWSALVVAAAKTVVQAMTTDVWAQVKSATVKLLGRGTAGKEQALSGELEESRAEVCRAAADGALDDVVSAAEAEWRERIEALLRHDPDPVTSLREFVDEFGAIASSHGYVRQHIEVRDQSTAFIVGKGDQHIFRYDT